MLHQPKAYVLGRSMVLRHFLAVALSLGALAACRTSDKTSITKDQELVGDYHALPAATQAAWDAYVSQLQNTANLQPACVPIQLRPKTATPEQGLVVIFHGFTGCSIQFINIARQLADAGYHVLLPLLPGEGRAPLVKDAATLDVKDDLSGMPNNPDGYAQFAEEINALARTYPGYKVMSGLSGGGAQAMGCLAQSTSDREGRGLWDRALIFVPFFKIAGIAGRASDIITLSAPGFGAGWGKECKASQLKPEPERRNGQCDFTIGQAEAMERYGAGAAKDASSIKTPIQYAGVVQDPTVDNRAIVRAFEATGATDKHLCFYPKGVSHAILYEGDYLYPQTRPWAREVEAMMLAFIKGGTPFPSDQAQIQDGGPLCVLSPSAMPPRGS